MTSFVPLFFTHSGNSQLGLVRSYQTVANSDNEGGQGKAKKQKTKNHDKSSCQIFVRKLKIAVATDGHRS